MKALVVDDSRATRAILRRLLQNLRFDVVEAGNGAEALELLERDGPADVALVDWHMPVMDGITFIRELRRQRAYTGMSVMMVSAESDRSQIARALMVGADEFVIKPLTSDVLTAKLETIEATRELEPMSVNAHQPVASTPLAAADFAYVAALLRERAAIEIGPDKQYLVEQRLSAVARQEQLVTIGALLARARRDPTGDTIRLVVDAMTTNETSFFRDPAVFDFLRTDILPEAIERNRATRQLRIWCGASSSGQEPYSVAMLLADSFPELARGWTVRLLATDLSPTMLERTARGAYSRIEVNRGLPASYLVKHFEHTGLDWQISTELRRAVTTREMNLARPFPFTEQFDLVLLRNVLIYFSAETKRAVLHRIRRTLAPGGHLFLGASESTMHIDDSWVRRTHGTVSCYQAGAPAPEEGP